MAEWEHACRAGTTTRFSFGDDEATLAYYGGYTMNSNDQPAQVGSRLCNAWGLFDMHGNASEWCWDRHADYESGVVEDPIGPTQGRLRVIRGGSWRNNAVSCGWSSRAGTLPGYDSGDLGFRVAAVPSGK